MCILYLTCSVRVCCINDHRKAMQGILQAGTHGVKKHNVLFEFGEQSSCAYLSVGSFMKVCANTETKEENELCLKYECITPVCTFGQVYTDILGVPS